MFKQLPREDGLPHTVINRHFVSRLHQIYTEEQEKRGLVPFDDKRYLLANLPDGSPNPNTHAYGHYSIHIQQQQILDAPKDLPLDLTGRPLTEEAEDDAHLPLADLPYLASVQPTRDQCATRRHISLHSRVVRQLANHPHVEAHGY